MADSAFAARCHSLLQTRGMEGELSALRRWKARASEVGREQATSVTSVIYSYQQAASCPNRVANVSPFRPLLTPSHPNTLPSRLPSSTPSPTQAASLRGALKGLEEAMFSWKQSSGGRRMVHARWRRVGQRLQWLAGQKLRERLREAQLTMLRQRKRRQVNIHCSFHT